VACPHFEELDDGGTIESEARHPSERQWKYTAPPGVEPSQIIKALSNLNAALPKPKKDETQPSVFQHTLQTLSDLTGYISSNVYMPYRPPNGIGMSSSYDLSPAGEALKKEIKALKGLVLSR
jgi:hypothetical protein